MYAHDQKTKHKASHYGGAMEVQEGVFVQVLIQLATNSEYRKKLTKTDQMVFDPQGVEAVAMWFKICCTETLEKGSRTSR